MKHMLHIFFDFPTCFNLLEGLFWLPQIPFAFQFECEQANDLCMAELPFYCSEIMVPFLLKTAEWQFG